MHEHEAELARDCLQYSGRYFKNDEDGEARHAISECLWARDVLMASEVMYQNGRSSWVVAGEVFEAAEDRLIDFLRVPG